MPGEERTQGPRGCLPWTLGLAPAAQRADQPLCLSGVPWVLAQGQLCFPAATRGLDHSPLPAMALTSSALRRPGSPTDGCASPRKERAGHLLPPSEGSEPQLPVNAERFNPAPATAGGAAGDVCAKGQSFCPERIPFKPLNWDLGWARPPLPPVRRR